MTEAEKAVLDEAVMWWIRRRPFDYDEARHLSNPIFDTQERDAPLAIAIARLVRERKFP